MNVATFHLLPASQPKTHTLPRHPTASVNHNPPDIHLLLNPTPTSRLDLPDLTTGWATLSLGKGKFVDGLFTKDNRPRLPHTDAQLGASKDHRGVEQPLC